MPVAWAFIEVADQKAIAVLFGYWVVIWPLYSERDQRLDCKKITRLVYQDWLDTLREKFHEDDLPQIKPYSA